NLFNDYYDFLHGQDKEKWTVDVSDAKSPTHQTVPYLAIMMICAAIAIGIWLAVQSTLWIIPVGIAGIIFGYLYSAGPRPLCSFGLGATVALLLLGPVGTILSYLVQAYILYFTFAAHSLPFDFLLASMILTNNIRDIEKDHTFRKTLAMILERNRAINLLTVLLCLTYVIVLFLAAIGILPPSAIIVLLSLPFASRLRWSLQKNATRAEKVSGMKWAAWHHWE